MSFKQFGGLNYAAKNNIIGNLYSNSINSSATNLIGQENSKITSQSHLDMSANSMVNIGSLYFMDGSIQSTAAQIEPGSSGPTGPQGSTGSQGPTGSQGTQGTQGVTGPQGQQGQQGVTGPQGTQGVQGVTGSQGPTGQQGVTGPLGSNILDLDNEWTGQNTFNINTLNAEPIIVSSTQPNNITVTGADSINQFPPYTLIKFTAASGCSITFAGSNFNSPINILCVGGGGGGSYGGTDPPEFGGGGGGGGGVSFQAATPSSAGTITFSVGQGGTAGTPPVPPATNGTNGTAGGTSTVSGLNFLLTSTGGGGGGFSTAGIVGTGAYANGGIGGTGTIGYDPSNLLTAGSNGGTGSSYILPSGTILLSGGGGGGTQVTNNTYFTGGNNGGTGGYTLADAGSGTPYTGGGGGGGSAPNYSTFLGTGAGGSGVIYVWYNTNNYYATVTQSIAIAPFLQGQAYNPITQSGDGAIVYGDTLNSGYNSSMGLSIVPHSTTAGGIRLDNVGNLTVTGTCTAVSFNSTSDYRIKDQIQPLNESFSVDNLKSVTYINKNSGKPDIGFIAHEVQEIFPYLVSGEKDAEQMQSLNYIGLIGVLVKEIQELKKRIRILETNK